ncbi:zincin-like metallopeptidase domain-containing protein [Mesomycoplasma neurolyticum]|uniref:DNA primase TraC n=1 Tax=Mesomycoplasma neurolyticum TaxID=2120 RepID=A0A449A5M8_9BACT|nr:zincin-like metallopeptidase domain-containing protein [Mesomycoplasma neurolyticum]VEU59590.1 DNA primase TraC [Mesomycoplasma neurolyticum]
MKNLNKLLDERKKIVEQIIKNLKTHNYFWDKNFVAMYPLNFVSNKNYNGTNILRLQLFSEMKNIQDPRFLTFKQILNRSNLKLKKGAKGCSIEYWGIKQLDESEIENNGKKQKTNYFFGKTYYVFNAKDVENIPKYKNKFVEVSSDKRVDYLIKNLSKALELKVYDNVLTETPHFSPNQDYIQMPTTFVSPEAKIAVFFHELTHWTGHKDRLNRTSIESYSKNIKTRAIEELVAELGAIFLNSKFGFQTKKIQDNNYAYIQSWIKILEDNPNELFKAANKANEAVEYISQKLEKYLDTKKNEKQIIDNSDFLAQDEGLVH